jgi:hypothetical protein
MDLGKTCFILSYYNSIAHWFEASSLDHHHCHHMPLETTTIDATHASIDLCSGLRHPYVHEAMGSICSTGNAALCEPHLVQVLGFQFDCWSLIWHHPQAHSK